MTSLPPALLLDLDDTILSDSARVDECWEHGIQLHASPLGADGMRRLMEEIVAARVWYWGDRDRHRTGRLDLAEARRFVVREALRRMGTPNDDMGTRVADAYSAKRDELIEPFPGAIDAVRRIREAGTRTALITNGSGERQRAKIERFELASLFDCIVVEGEFGAGKPEEAVYRHALSELGAEPRDAWMAGDNLEWDVAGPQKLGVTGIWMDVQGRGLPPESPVRPDRIIRSLVELLP